MSKAYTYRDGLETKRLTTRFLTPGDIIPWSNFFKDKKATEYFAPDPLAPEEKARIWIGRQLARYTEQRFGLQAIVDKNTGQFIGQCGLLAQEVDGMIETEVAYHIFKKYWGQGYAPEAARLFIDFAFQNDLADSVISIIDKRNSKSQRVAEKNGLVQEKQTKWQVYEVFIYRIHQRDWI